MSEVVTTSQQGLAGKYRPYPEYKDSGVEWLGVIPTHWSLHALKRTVSDCSNGIWGDEPNGESDLIVLRVADFDRNKLTISDDKLTYRSISERERKTRLLKKGDLLIEKSGGGEKTLVGCVVIFDKEYSAVTSNFVAKMSPRKAYCSNFLNYAFSHLYVGRVNYPSIKQTTGIQNLDSDSYLMEHFCFPYSSEQQTIAAFLDHETARIDRLIAQQQRLIELLKEKRQAVISHAVTKGLNPNAPMKDSGVEWLGQVPEHWQLTKLKWISKTTSGSTPNTSEPEKYYDDGVYPWVRTTDLNNGRLVNTPVHITDAAIKDTACSLLPIGSVLIAMYGGAGSIGKHALLAVEATTNQAVCAILPSAHLVPEYLDLFAEYYRPFWMVSAEGTRKDPNIGQDHIREMLLPIPPLDEQNEIQAYIYVQISLYEKGQDIAIKQMGLLQERRTALISAAVTGKIDLRSWNPPHA